MTRITDKTIKILAEKLSSDHAKIMLLSLETGMRAQEIITLNPKKDIDFESKVARLQRSKSGNKHDIELSDKAIEMY